MSLALPHRRHLADVGPRSRWVFATLAAVSFALPIRLFNVGEVEVPLALFMVMLGIPTLLRLHQMVGGRLLLLSAGLGLVSVCAWDLSPASANSVRPYLSFVFFFLPYLAYGAGYTLIRRCSDFKRFIATSSAISAISGLAIVASLIVSGSPVRIEGDLLGNLAGMPLYATHGVNSLAITEFILFAFIWIDLLFQGGSSWPLFLLKLGGLLALGALVFLSLSRGAVLSWVGFLFLSLIALAFKQPRVAAVVSLTLLCGAAYIGSTYADLLSLAWGTRIGQTSESLSEGEANALTSGRLTLGSAALADLGDNPVFGVGFTGFHEGRSTFTEEDALNSSPHNQYLTMLWKPGPLAGGVLILFLGQCMSRLNRLRRHEGSKGTFTGLWCMMIALLLVACFTWDILLVPNIGALVMFLFGACASLTARDRLA